jgi:hypothetical protein
MRLPFGCVRPGWDGRYLAVTAASIGLDNYMTDPASLTRTPGPTPTSTATRQADDMTHPTLDSTRRVH